jgi:hypothetical protein
MCPHTCVHIQDREWFGPISDEIDDDDSQAKDSPEVRDKKTQIRHLLQRAAETPTGRLLGNLVAASLKEGKIPGVSHGKHNIVAAGVAMLAPAERINGVYGIRAANLMRERLIQDVTGIHASSVPETEAGMKAAMQLCAKYGRENAGIKTEKGMARLPTAGFDAFLAQVKVLSPMMAASVRLDGLTGYGVTATFPSIPAGFFDGALENLLGEGSYMPEVNGHQAEVSGTHDIEKTAAGLTFRKLIESSKPQKMRFGIALFDNGPAMPVWKRLPDGSLQQTCPFDRMEAVAPATSESWIMRTGYQKEYFYNMRCEAMLQHDLVSNTPPRPKPVPFAWGAFGEVRLPTVCHLKCMSTVKK